MRGAGGNQIQEQHHKCFKNANQGCPCEGKGGQQQGLRQDSQGGQREGEHLGHCQGYMYEGQSGETTRVTNMRGGVEFPREVTSEGWRERTHHPEVSRKCWGMRIENLKKKEFTTGRGEGEPSLGLPLMGYQGNQR